MKIDIEYCGVRNYLPRASGLAAKIEKQTGIKPTLIEGSDGVFEISVDGDLIFSKKAKGRFPEDDEVFGPLSARS